MDQRNARQLDALRQAAQLLGGKAQLAGFLAVAEDQLERWMANVDAAPLWVFVEMNDLVADGPSGPQRSSSVARRRNDSSAKRSA